MSVEDEARREPWPPEFATFIFTAWKEATRRAALRLARDYLPADSQGPFVTSALWADSSPQAVEAARAFLAGEDRTPPYDLVALAVLVDGLLHFDPAWQRALALRDLLRFEEGRAERLGRYRHGPSYMPPPRWVPRPRLWAGGLWGTELQRKAQGALRYAVRTGVVARKTCCESCGARHGDHGGEVDLWGQPVGTTVCVDAHHHKGYAREHWLDVVWLCRSCHMRTEREAAEQRAKPAQLVLTL